MDIKWDRVSPEGFEKFCRRILVINEFSNIKWYGKSGGDRRRDLTAEKIEIPLPGIKYTGKWIVECKRFISRAPNNTDLERSIDWSITHKPDYLFFIITNTLSSNTKDWIEERKKGLPFRIYIWEEQDILDEIKSHPDLEEFLISPDEYELTIFASKFYQAIRRGIEESNIEGVKLIPFYSKFPFLIKVVKNQKYNHVYIYFKVDDPREDVIFEETDELPENFDSVLDEDIFYLNGDEPFYYFALPPRGGYTDQSAEREGRHLGNEGV